MAEQHDGQGPVLFGYDGSEHAKAAIEQAGRQLKTGRPAVVATIWQPLETLPFYGAAGVGMGGDIDAGLGEHARDTAQEGVELAKQAGFDATPAVDSGMPVWSRIVELADERGAEIVVLGSQGRSGVGRVLMGSVASAVVNHSTKPVLVVRRPDE